MKNQRLGQNFMNHSRRGQSRPEKKILLIVCEGRETERNYFDQLKREEWTRQHFTITVKRGKGGTRDQIAQFAVDRKNDYDQDFDEVWCVMDTEEPSQRELLCQALQKLEENSIKPCLSNPSIEVWFLTHFKRTCKSFYNCDQVVTELHNHWQKHFGSDYEKADPLIFDRLKRFIYEAIDNARLVRETDHDSSKHTADCNSSTDVYKLVEKLVTPKN